MKLTLVAAGAVSLMWLTSVPLCVPASFEAVMAHAVEDATAPELSVSHIAADGVRYHARYSGFQSTGEFLRKNRDCCEDVTDQTRLEGVPPDEMRRLGIATAIKVTSRWVPITPRITKDFVMRRIYYYDACGKRINLPH